MLKGRMTDAVSWRQPPPRRRSRCRMCAAPTPPANCRSGSGITGCPAPTTPRTALVKEWGEKEKVEVSIDYITSQGNKNLLTIAAESQAKSGHDIFAFPTWEPQAHAKHLEPVDDVMAELIKLNGKVNPTVDYLARAGGRWLAVPATVGSQIKGPCSRIDLHEKARRHRRAGDVSGRRPAEGRCLDAGRHAQGRRSLPQGGLPVRHRARRHRGQHRHRRARSSSRSAPIWSTPRATSRSRTMPSARRSNTTRSSRSSCRRTRRPGTTRPTTSS